jgi:arabinogalactan oligomer/maltooligosaccharide transport system permease protein
MVAGTAVASLLFTTVAWLVLGRAAVELSRQGEQRRAMVSVRALADLVQRAGGKGDAARAAVEAWAQEHPQLGSLRVVSLDDVSLEASTAPEDKGEKAAPRQLTDEEKPLFDRGGDLRTAVDTNRQEGGALKAEVDVVPLGRDRLAVAVPVEQEGSVVSMVSAQAVLRPEGRPDLTVALAVALVPILLVFLLGLGLGEKRWPLLAAAVVIVVGAEAFYLSHIRSVLERERREAEGRVAAQLEEDGARAAGLLAQLNLPAEPALAPGSWDADLFRRPLGFSTPKGGVNEARLSADLAERAKPLTKGLLGTGAFSLMLLLVFGLGGAARVAATASTYRQAYAYVTPAMFGMLVLVFFPFIYGIVLSFTDQTLFTGNKPILETWVGLKNYLEIIQDRGFYWTLFFTIMWTVTNVTVGVTVGLCLALILNTKNLAMRAAYRVLLILPWAMPNYITALIWKGMFHQQFGVVNQVLAMVGVAPLSWFDRPFTSFLTALATNGWLSFPFMMVVSLGALQSIPGELYEAARVDGASRWQAFRAITLPSLKPALVPAIILSVVWTFNMFNIIFLVTAGEPGGSTEILITQAYKLAFEKYRYGYAAAYSTVIFGILVVYGSIQNRLTRATEAA